METQFQELCQAHGLTCLSVMFYPDRVVVFPHWNDELGRKKKRSAPPLTAEQQAKFDAKMDAACAALESGNAEEFFASIREGNAALDRNDDREARKAVEGDTDLNHDNLEG